VRIGDIFRAVDGPIATVACVLPDTTAACQRSGDCAAQVLWSGLSKTIENFLDAVTLEDLCAIARQLSTHPDAGCQNAIDTLEMTLAICSLALNNNKLVGANGVRPARRELLN